MDTPSRPATAAAPDMWTDSTEVAIPIAATLLTDPQFKQHLDTLRSCLYRSLDARSQPMPLLELQAEMAAFSLGVHTEQRRLEQELRTTHANDSDLGQLRKVIGVCKRLRALARQVGDGIAWRTLDYDRIVLYLLALKPQTGAMELASALSEIDEAQDWAEETGELVVINDMTNFMRHGDFTSAGSDGVTIHEVKSGRASAKSRRSRRQARRTAEVIDFVRRAYAVGEDGITTAIVGLKTKLFSHVDDLDRLIQEARRTGSAYGRLSDCLSVNVFDSIQVGEKFASGTKMRSLAQDPFDQSPDVCVADSLKFYTGFSWNVAPHSVFPLQVEDRFAIMTGAVWVVTSFNFGNLYKCLRRRNLYVKPPDKSRYEELEGLMPGDVARRELDNPLAVSRGPGHPVLLIPTSGLTRLLYEFLDEEAFADAVEEKLESPNPGRPMQIRTAFDHEADLWD